MFEVELFHQHHSTDWMVSVRYQSDQTLYVNDKYVRHEIICSDCVTMDTPFGMSSKLVQVQVQNIGSGGSLRDAC